MNKLMKKGIKIIVGVIAVIALLLLILKVTDRSYLLNGARIVYWRGHKNVGIYDYTVEHTRTIIAKPGQPWQLDSMYNKIPLSDSILKLHKELQTTAFLIIKDGKILSENYFNEGAQDKLSGVWSVTKTYTTLLILKAIEDGLIESLDDPVTKYLPEWKVKQDKPLTIRHLACMSTGLFWDEDDKTPFSLIAKLNFYDNMEKFIFTDMYAVGSPGDIQHYDSGGMQMLGIILKRVLKGRSISEYLAEKLWQPLGAEHNALYVLDSQKQGNEKTFGGLVATARDISRLGQLINDNGIWGGKQILSDADMQTIKAIPFHNKTYSYGIWTGLYHGQRFYYQSGFLGQFCISFPDEHLVITRFGHHNLKKADLEDVSKETYLYIDEAFRMIDEIKK
jgi:CubicO group peptidase (beta-lactamase class C family)